VSYNEVLDAHEKATGSKWKRTYVSIEDAEKRIKENNNPWGDFGTYLRVWQAKGLVSKNNVASEFSVKPFTAASLFV
jgi:molybdopterin biosynthesis enzyme